VIPVFSRRLSMAADVASVQFSRTVERRNAGWPSLMAVTHFDVSPTRTGGRRSLKTQQHAGSVFAAHRRPTQVAKGERPSRGHPARFGRHARPDPLGHHPPRGRVAAGSGHRLVLPRKEVIQPRLPLRLPCSRGSPCRHEAWTISSSSLLEAKLRVEQTSLPRVPRTHTCRESFVARCQNVKPPEIWIYSAARVMDPTTIYAFRHEHRS